MSDIKIIRELEHLIEKLGVQEIDKLVYSTSVRYNFEDARLIKNDFELLKGLKMDHT